MRIPWKMTLTALAALIVLAACIVILVREVHLSEARTSQAEAFPCDTIHCVIAVDMEISTMEFSTGFDYELLRRFAARQGRKAHIVLERDFEGCLDSLLVGRVDIVAENWSYALSLAPELLCSHVYADSSCWIVPASEKAAMDSILLWQGDFCHTEEYDSLRRLFSAAYIPSRRAAGGRKFRDLSPYDSLLAAKAAELGWPRTLLTAMVWNESHFHIEAHSRKGAAGLMQIIPRTARRYGIANPIDPEENLSAAVKYLKRLERIFAPYAADSDELRKFVLAAFNAGEGRMRGCMLYAASVAAPHSRWSDIVALQPRMKDDYYGGAAPADSLLEEGDNDGSDTLRLAASDSTLADADYDSLTVDGIARKPLSRQTIAYVESILSTEALLRSISATGP